MSLFNVYILGFSFLSPFGLSLALAFFVFLSSFNFFLKNQVICPVEFFIDWALLIASHGVLLYVPLTCVLPVN